LLDIQVQSHEVIFDSRLCVSFQRTRRLPAEGGPFPPPNSLRALPVHDTAAYRAHLPTEWISRPSIFLPVVPGEAFWIGFRGSQSKPSAVKVTFDELDAISGTLRREGLHNDPQDYIVCPPQPSLDGIYASGHLARQFVATEVREREGNMTALRPPMRMLVYDPKEGRFSGTLAAGPRPTPDILHFPELVRVQQGSLVEQGILPDPHGAECWDQTHFGSLSVYWLNPEDYYLVTGQESPAPASASEGYQGYLLP
jgi:hypothetical protein